MDSWVQYLIGPATILLIGWQLDRRSNKRIGAVDEKTQAVKEQVQNSHTTNLRDDFDLLLQAQDRLATQQRAHHEEFRTFRGAALDRLRSVETKADDQRRAQEHLSERFDAHLDRAGKRERADD